MFDKKLLLQHIQNRPRHIEEQRAPRTSQPADPPTIIPTDPNSYGDYTPRPRIKPHQLTPDQIAAQDKSRATRKQFEREQERQKGPKEGPRAEFDRDMRPSEPADPAPVVDPNADGDRFGNKITDAANRLAKTGAYTQDELDRISTGQTGRPDKFTPNVLTPKHRRVDYPPVVPPSKPKAPSGGAGPRQPMEY